jgi:hypothetical protein
MIGCATGAWIWERPPIYRKRWSVANPYEEKQERRKERLLAKADRLDGVASSRFQLVDQMAGVMNGQPILIGHHSEKRHRRDLERMDRNMRKGVEATEHAKELRARATSVGKGGISSDDPEALTKLARKLENMKRERERIKAVNKAWRQAGKPAPDNHEGWLRVDKFLEASPVGAQLTDEIRLQFARFTWWDSPVPSYELRNLGANIKRVEGRIEALKLEEERAPAEDIEGNGFTISEDPADNRILIVFDEKPPKEVCKKMRAYGFRWSPSRVAWVRHLNAQGRAMAEYVAAELSRNGSFLCFVHGVVPTEDGKTCSRCGAEGRELEREETCEKS